MGLQRSIVTAVLLIFTGLMFILPSVPAAAATCSYKSCDGKSPVTTGCSMDGQTYAAKSIVRNGAVIGKVELRGSPTCAAYWSRVTSYIGAQNLNEGVFRYDLPGHQNGSQTSNDYGTSAYTHMLGAFEEQIKACGWIQVVNDYTCVTYG